MCGAHRAHHCTCVAVPHRWPGMDHMALDRGIHRHTPHRARGTSRKDGGIVMTRLASGLPKGDANGLYAIAHQLLDDPLQRHVVVAVVDCSKITTDTATGARDATVRVLRIEQVHPDD